MTTTTRRIHQLLGLMHVIGEQTGHDDISLHQIKVLLYSALRDQQGDPAESREICKQLGLSRSGVSRAVASLGTHGRGGRAGLRLITAEPDLMDRRRKPVLLTRKGRQAIEKIVEAS